MGINNFKVVNDEWGHQIGDKALQMSGDFFQSYMKTYCGQNPCAMGRWGGDEFVFFLPKSDDFEIKTFVDEMKDEFKKYFTDKLGSGLFENLSTGFGISVGVAEVFPDKPETIDSIIDRADKKMYEDKHRSS